MGAYLQNRIKNMAGGKDIHIESEVGQYSGKNLEELQKDIKTFGRQQANGQGLDKGSAKNKEAERQFEENYQGL